MESATVALKSCCGDFSAVLKKDGNIITTTAIPTTKNDTAGLPEELVSPPVVNKTPMTPADEVRVLTVADYKPAAYSIALAFWEDHSSRYFIDTPDRAHWSEKQKWDLHLKMMEYITYAHLLKGVVVCAGRNYDCVALWMPPGANMDTNYVLLRSGLWRLSYLLSSEGRTRFFSEFLPLLNITKSTVLGVRDPDSWYLVYIGTRPSGRGKGFARKCIDFITEKADRTGKACYLESSSEVNRKIYGKMGFVLQREIFLQRGKGEHVSLDIMVREPEEREGDADSGVDVV